MSESSKESLGNDEVTRAAGPGAPKADLSGSLLDGPLKTWGLPGALAVVALVYDPGAEAADLKRVVGLLLAALAFAARRQQASSGFGGPPDAVPPSRGFELRLRDPRTMALGVLLLSVVSLIWGVPSGHRDAGTLLVAFAAAEGMHRISPKQGLLALRRTAALVAAISSGVVLVQAAFGGRGFALHGGQGNPNWLGLLLALLLPVLVDAHNRRGAQHQRRNRIRRGAQHQRRPHVMGALVLLATSAALYLSHSRVAWVASAISLSAYGLFALRGRTRFAVPVVLAACLLGGLALRGPQEIRSRRPLSPPADPHQASRIAEDWGTRDVAAPLAMNGRIAIANVTARVALQHPFGVGLGGFAHAFLAEQGAELAQLPPPAAARRFVNATTAHNEYVQIASESGWLACALFVAALALRTRDLCRARAFGAAASMLAFAIAALADSPLRQPACALFVGALFGLRLPGEVRASVSAPHGVARWVWAIPLVLSAWFLSTATRTWLSTRMLAAAERTGPKSSAALLAKAQRLDPNSGEVCLALGIERLEHDDPRAAIAPLKKADRLVADTSLRIALGSAYLAAHEHGLAIDAYRSALAYNPGSFRAHLGLAESLFGKGDLTAADAEAVLSKRLRPGDPRVFDLLDRIHEAQMDAPQAPTVPLQ